MNRGDGRVDLGRILCLDGVQNGAERILLSAVEDLAVVLHELEDAVGMCRRHVVPVVGGVPVGACSCGPAGEAVNEEEVDDLHGGTWEWRSGKVEKPCRGAWRSCC